MKQIDPALLPADAIVLSDAALDPGEPADHARVRRSGLLDDPWYREINADVPRARADPLGHFMDEGWREGRWPNAYFDTAHYLRQNSEVARSGENPLVHYLREGEAAGCAPAAYFDLLWYRSRHTPAPGETLLRHFLDRRLTGEASPLPEFDPAFYLTTYPDIAAAGVDPFEHFLRWGFREGRNPSAAFDTRFYMQRYLDSDPTQNPVLHYRAFRHVLRLHPQPPAHEHAMFDEVRKFTRPGKLFEARTRLPRTAPRRAKLLAYYLPQFHAVAENDSWWGEGFTEWTSVARGQPRFAGHYQPRIPRDLGHYSLDDPETMRRQIGMAKDAGLFGFVQYFYWFNGHRLLERPLEAFLADRSLDFPFCLMWANENWTRRWDGSDHEVLISQDYREADDMALTDAFARHFSDPRYIRVEGRPLLMVYRAGHIPRSAATVARWRGLWRERHGENPLLLMAQTFDDHDPRAHGFDAAIEFPPHKLTASMPAITNNQHFLDTRADPQVFDYAAVAAASLAEPAPDYPLIRTAVPGWDNDARREGRGLVIHGATPSAYQAWLEALIEQARKRPWLGESFVCINAWNEWAEGAYLEPDVHFGAAFLNATGRAVVRSPATVAPGTMLLIGHDAFPAGAQMLLLHLGRALQRGFGARVEFLLLGKGALLAAYEAAAPTQIVAEPAALEGALAAHVARGMSAAIVNTSAAAHAVGALARLGVAATLLIHELPRLLTEKNLTKSTFAAMAQAARVVVPAAAVRDALLGAGAPTNAPWRVMPQGCYRPIVPCPSARVALRARLGLTDDTTLMLGAGYGDLRKGFDLFLQTWRAARRHGANGAFCWIGELDPKMRAYLGGEIAEAEATQSFFAPGHQDDPAPWFAAADVFLLTSREDPYPSVVLEAMTAGLPVVAFEGGGGIPELLARGGGACVAMADADAMASAAIGLAGERGKITPVRLTADKCAAATPPPNPLPQGEGGLSPSSPLPLWGAGEGSGRESISPQAGLKIEGRKRKSLDRAAMFPDPARRFDFQDYVAALLAEARPDLLSISVAVPSCDYARYMPGRLTSIFAQTHPVREILMLDDASIDDSVAVARDVAADWNRDLALSESPTRSGSPFGQWRRAAAAARGEFLWIAEADDEADPAMLARLAGAARATPDIVLAVCDSRSIDGAGAPVWPDYQAYYAQSGGAALAQDLVLPAREFARLALSPRNLLLNVSAVLWRRAALVAALDRCPDLPSWRVAGDWRVYLEALAESDGHVAWVAAPLNAHRRHPASASAKLKRRRHLAEATRMHALLAARLDLTPEEIARQSAYRATLAAPARGPRTAAS